MLQGISDFYDFETEFNIFKEMSKSSGRPISITVEQMDQRPDWWHQLLDGIEEAQGEGVNMYGQVPPRATGINMGLTATLNPFTFYPSFYELSKKSLEEKVATMKDQAFKDIKNASVKIAIESVGQLLKNSLDKSKLDKLFVASIEETKIALKKKSS